MPQSDLRSHSPSLVIAFRHYREDLYNHRSRDPQKKRPEWFSNSLCLTSLLVAIKACPSKNKIRLLIWYDGTEEDFATDPVIHLLTTQKENLNIAYHRHPYGSKGDNSGERQSFPVLLKYLTEQVDDELVYLVENDYLHRPAAISALLEAFAEINDADYVNLADHRDYYHLPIHKNYHLSLHYSSNFIFKNCATSTGTFAARRTTLARDLPVILHEPDYTFFTRLTGIHGRKLYTSIPGQAAHCMNNLLPPGVNWDRVATETLKHLGNFTTRP
jgi:hypothetical protein